MIIKSAHMNLEDPLTGGDCHDRLDLAGVKVELVDVPRQSFDVVAVADRRGCVCHRRRCSLRGRHCRGC